MRIGLHVSAAGGADQAVLRAKELGCETFQFFSRPPQGGTPPKLTPELLAAFKTNMRDAGFVDAIIHTPYFINLASTNPRIYKGSIQVIREELERATLLEVPFVVTHLGSAKEVSRAAGMRMVSDGLKKILKGYHGTAKLLLENSAGAGNVMGATCEDLGALLKPFGKTAPIGICLDTCHVFASGYDIRTKADIAKLVTQIEKTVGLARLHFIHANDSKGALGDHKDRHEHIGDGQIGKPGFAALLSHPKLQHISIVLETHHDGKHITDLRILQKLKKHT